MYSLITNRVYDIFTFDNTIQISEIEDEIADLKAIIILLLIFI